MNDFTRVLNGVAEQWYSMMSTAVVQSLLLLLLAAVVSTLLRKQRASLRFWLWQFIALKLLALPFSLLVFVLPLPTSPPPPSRLVMEEVDLLPYSVSYPDPVGHASPLPTYRESLTSITYLFLGWLSALVVQLAWCLRRRLALRRLLATCEPASRAEQARVEQLTSRLGLSRTVQLLLGDVDVPLVTGIFRPCIVLPAEHGLSQERFDQVILHELTHVKRNDLLWVWIPELARMIFFFHPLVYWVRFQANLCREMACDQSVLFSGANRRQYARTLLELAGA